MHLGYITRINNAQLGLCFNDLTGYFGYIIQIHKFYISLFGLKKGAKVTLLIVCLNNSLDTALSDLLLLHISVLGKHNICLLAIVKMAVSEL